MGRFRIGERLGRGATGEVYRAEDTKLKRVVALKRLAADLHSDQTYRRRFQEEAEQVSRFSDAHVAALYDVLEDQDEMLLVMEYVEGQTLRKRMASPLTLEQFMGIALQCAEALAAAHELGIIHCDVKPENIMLTASDQVKILDFGLAKHLPRSDQSSTLESSTTLAGTPAYMSPEVLLQRVPDGRSDVFSLGVMFYEMLSGHHPFLAGSFIATIDRIRKETPTPIRIFNSQVPRELESIVGRAMAKDPQQRYASARELLQDLRLVQAGQGPGTAPVDESRRKPRRIPPWIVMVTASLLLSVAAALLYRYLHPPPVLAERGWVLVSDFETRGDELIPDEGIREGLTIALQQSRYVNVFPRTRIYDVLQRMKKPEVTRIDESLGREICQRENLQVLMTGSIEQVSNVFQITVRALNPVQGNLLFAEQERFDRRDQFLDRADAIAKRVREDLGESLVGIQNRSRPLAKVSTASIEALQLYSQGVDAMAQGNLDRVPALLQGALKFDPNFAMAHMLLGTYYSWLVGKNRRALAEFERAYELREGGTDRERRRIEAFYYSALERYDEAAQSLSVLVGLYPDDAEAHEELASAYFNLGQLDAAIAELRQVLRLDPFSALAYRNTVLYLARKGAYQEALAAFHEAEQRGIKAPELHWGLGLAYLSQGDISRAREEFVRLGEGPPADQELKELYLAVSDLYEGKLQSAATKLRRQSDSAPPESEGLKLVRSYLIGRILLDQNKKREAVLEADRMLRSPSSTLQTNDLLQAGVLYARAGDLRRARTVLKRLDQLRASAPNSWAQSSFHNLEGEIYTAQARPVEAEKSFTSAVRESPQVLSHIGLARLYHGQGNWTAGAEEWEKVLLARGEILQNDFPPDLALAHFRLAQSYQQLNRRDLAIRHCQELLRMWQHADQTPLLGDAKRLLAELTRDQPELNHHQL